jgi:hypothetical protein
MLESAFALMRTSSSWPQNREPTRLWPVSLIIVAAVGLSFGFTCAIPFAALATFAALKLDQRDALLAIGAAWLLNQAVGFGCLNYPRTSECFIWGIGMGAAAYITLISALRAAQYVRDGAGGAITALTLSAALATFNITLFVIGLVIPGNHTTFSLPGFAKILVINAVTVPLLLLINYFGLRLRSVSGPEFTDDRPRAWYEQRQDPGITT